MKEIFSRNFSRLVEASGLSQREIARMLKVTEPTFYRWKNGENVPDFKTIDELAKILNVKASEFYSVDKVEVLNLPVSKTLKIMSNIPDEIYDLAEKVGDDKRIWDAVRGTLQGQLIVREKREENNKKNQA